MFLLSDNKEIYLTIQQLTSCNIITIEINNNKEKIQCYVNKKDNSSYEFQHWTLHFHKII